jgi:hypothetical protein
MGIRNPVQQLGSKIKFWNPIYMVCAAHIKFTIMGICRNKLGFYFLIAIKIRITFAPIWGILGPNHPKKPSSVFSFVIYSPKLGP